MLRLSVRLEKKTWKAALALGGWNLTDRGTSPSYIGMSARLLTLKLTDSWNKATFSPPQNSSSSGWPTACLNKTPFALRLFKREPSETRCEFLLGSGGSMVTTLKSYFPRTQKVWLFENSDKIFFLKSKFLIDFLEIMCECSRHFVFIMSGETECLGVRRTRA